MSAISAETSISRVLLDLMMMAHVKVSKLHAKF